MKRKLHVALIALLASAAFTLMHAQGTAFTYQGRLADGSGLATGNYNLRFALYDALIGGSSVGLPITNAPVAVSNGLFTVTLDFGASIFTGPARWLEIGVKTNGAAGNHTLLVPRQSLAAAPYAVFAGTASVANTATNVAANGVNAAAIQNSSIALGKLAPGVMQPSNFPPNSVTSRELADGISLGASNALGQLDVYSTGAGSPGISLFGGSSQISTYGSDGLEQSRIWGSSWGELFLFNNLPSNDLTVLLSANAGAGGRLFLNNSNGNSRAVLYGANSGGLLDLFDEFNGSKVRLSSSQNSYIMGNLGLGITTPFARLDVFDGVGQNGTVHVGGYGANGDPKLVRFGDGDFVHVGEMYRDDLLDLKGSIISLSSSLVGLGTTNPAANLEIYTPDNPVTMRLHSAAGFGSASLQFWSDPKDSPSEWRPGYIQSTDNGGFTGGLGFFVNGSGIANRLASVEVMRLVNGAVGIGTPTPFDAILDIEGNARLNDNDLFLRAANDRNHGIGYRNTVMGRFFDGPFVYGYNGGALGTAGPDAVTLHWDYVGNVWISNNLSVASLTVRGGADLAEPFQMSHADIPKGALVIIDEENPGKLKLSERACDTRVAGIVSGAHGINPGITLHQEGLIEGGQQVALSGRVYALVDATKQPIKPGDLLTSSDTPGHAMKVSDSAKAQGAIVGKAMTGLKSGKGMVLVLVTLQ